MLQRELDRGRRSLSKGKDVQVFPLLKEKYLTTREGILVALMAISSGDANEEVLVDSLKSQFRSWGDQVAAQDGDGLLVSMWYIPSTLRI